MYTNFLYFIVVLLVFSTKQPSLTPRLSAPLTLLSSVGMLALFALVNYWVFRRLDVTMSRLTNSRRVAVLYHRVVGRQSLLALVFFCLHIYLVDVKFYLTTIDLVDNSFTLQGLVALALFLLYLAVVWIFSFGCYCRLTSESCARSSLVLANFKFNLAIILPWVLISGSFDVLRFLPFASLQRHLNTPSGQIIFFAVLLLLFMVFAPPLVLRLWGCRPMPPGNRKSLIERFCREQGFQIREVVLWPTFGRDTFTAGVMGIHRRFRFLLITEPLLSILSDDELRAVLAHELGHVKERHMFFYMIFLLGYLILAYTFFDFFYLLLLASDFPALPARPDASQLTTLSLLSTLPLLILLVVYFRFLFGFFIRNFERQADLHVFTTTGRPLALVSALEKIGLYSGNIRDVPSWHHFSIKQRVDFLLVAASRPFLIRRHRSKLRKALSLYLVILVALGTSAAFLQTGILDTDLDEHLLVKVLNRRIQRDPENPRLRLALGTLQYERNNLQEAVHQLETGLQLDPDNPEIMNNLAWLLATARQSQFFDPKRAVTLAKKAVHISPKAYILDTLAEAYHARGQDHKALAVAEQALAAATGNASYYRKQVKRFRSLVDQEAALPDGTHWRQWYGSRQPGGGNESRDQA